MSQPPPPPPFPPSPQWPSPGSGSSGKTSRPLLWIAAATITLAVIVVVALVVVLLTRDDDGDDSADDRPTDASSQPSDPAPTEPSTEPSSTPTQAGPDNTAVVGEWYGRYRCTQGASAGRLTIEAVPGSSTQVTAVFRFGESIINDNVESGSYRMTGEVTDAQITLTAGEWIKQAPGYTTVDLRAPVTTSAPTELFGEVLSPGCQRFRFLRQ